MPEPTESLLTGSRRLGPLLTSHGFRFKFLGAGRCSGGNFAQAEFVNGTRRLELHFRQSLGLVTYFIGDHGVAHEPYMRALGVRHKCKYPGYSVDPLTGFDDLAHDLPFAHDFWDGSGSILLAVPKYYELHSMKDPRRLP
jgi:hypothetical protein